MPAVLAIAIGLALAVMLFVPYVAQQYRRRGEFGIGNAALAFTGLLYGLGLIAYVLIPLPELTPDFCATSGMWPPQWVPFNFLHDMQKEAVGVGLGATLRNPALTQVLLNVSLFVPLGMFVRHMFGRSVAATTVIALACSLLIEVTQVTGIWFLYPCPYRLFDVDDLMANSLGGLAGALAAPVLRAVPGQRLTAEPGAPRPVTRSRRLLASLCDLLLFQLSTVLVSSICTVLGIFPTRQADQLAASWLPWFVLVIALPLAGSATSIGQRIVHLRVTTADGHPPGVGPRLVRSLAGTGGYLLLVQLGELPGGPSGLAAFSVLAGIFPVASLIGLFTTSGYRGLSCAAARLRMTDARTPLRQPDVVSA
ncbi:hypothetical protein GCM10009533_66390 [Saccharopolyspora spinosporotrichia]|uniref:Glycopeptide antibiotics resistance protein n=1 Tax=Saccharopolyspora erythraea TaxID=1836 RepID=A0ABN1E698_SACER